MCVWVQRRAIKNFDMYVSLQSHAQKCMKFAFHSFARSMREGSSSQTKTCVPLQRRAIKNFEMYVSLIMRNAQKLVTVVFGNFSGWIRKLVFGNFPVGFGNFSGWIRKLSGWIRKLFRLYSVTCVFGQLGFGN